MYHPYSCVVSLLYLQMTITLPEEYPLGSVSVECGKRVGIKEDRWHRWVLQIRRLLSTHNGAVVDAIKLWKDNGASRSLSLFLLARVFVLLSNSLHVLSFSLAFLRASRFSPPPLLFCSRPGARRHRAVSDLLLDCAANAPDVAARALWRLPRRPAQRVPLQVVQDLTEEQLPDVPLLGVGLQVKKRESCCLYIIL